MSDQFELIVGPADGVIDNADVPVRWCVSPELVKSLEDKGIANPMVLLATFSKDGRAEWRTLIPLGDMLAYARFYKAGENVLYAEIIDGGNKASTSRVIRNHLLGKEYSNFTHDLQYAGNTYKRDAIAKSFVNVEIPNGCFGKEPPEWLKWYVNFWHEGKTDDECMFRRRAILAFTLKWMPVGSIVVGYFLMSLLVLLGTIGSGYKDRIDNWKDVFHPFERKGGGLFKIDSKKYGNRFLIWYKMYGETHPIISLTTFTPTGVAVMYLIMVAAYWISNYSFIWYNAHVATAHIVLTTFSILFVFDVVGIVVRYCVHNFSWNVITKESNAPVYFQYGVLTVGMIACLFAVYGLTLMPWQLVVGLLSIFGLAIAGAHFILTKGGIKTLDRWYDTFINWLDSFTDNDYTEVRELLCPKDVQNLSTDIKSIPKERQTLRLRYREIKAKFCNPMQR